MVSSKRRGRVFVELRNDRVFRIIKHPTYSPNESLAEMPRKEAVEDIRRQVFERADMRCQNCDTPVTWSTGHMDERIPKGKGGEVSLDNCQVLCPPCHIGKDGKHGNRFPKWSKKV